MFRRAIYEWDPSLDPDEKFNDTFWDEESGYSPRGTVAKLQALFSLMDFTMRRYRTALRKVQSRDTQVILLFRFRAADPNSFIESLGLDPQVQQDAQEFSKLFVSLLERTLARQTGNKAVSAMVQSVFRGEYAYVTKCTACRTERQNKSHFFELDLAMQVG